MSNGGPAFPVTDVVVNNQAQPSSNGGMTLRDYLAAAALPAVIAAAAAQRASPSAVPYHDMLAQSAYLFADAMIKARG
ncbi:hypothetical protein AWB70_01047 [Caballeronia cordobensis]|uniref:Uncharacterized protein n=2 Tax=Caballeronia cordobensis TaxID=1353886 RepID=A0A158FKT4_CABCO|nr:hypothetical protein [Caballeronia cordobensis]SAL20516.1 hypothetical protein AWB70_01047 [Caballeronia cordobensis]